MMQYQNKKIYFLFTSVFAVTIATSCTMNDVNIKKHIDSSEHIEEQTESKISNNNDTSANEELQHSDILSEDNEQYFLNDRVKCSNGVQLVSDGTMYLTITDAKAYKSFSDTGLPAENFHMDIQEYSNNSPFILLHVLFENIDATSYKYKFDKGMKSEGLDEYDFSAESLPFVISKQFLENDGFEQNYVYSNACYFDNSVVEQKKFGQYFHLEPGEKIEFDLGFMPIWGGIDSTSRHSDDYNPSQFFASCDGYKPYNTYIDLQISGWED